MSLSCGCLLLGAGMYGFGQQSSGGLYMGWSDYGGSADSAQYSALTQINRSNVTRLQVAWTYSTGDSNKYFFNPLIIDGVMYVMAKGSHLFAQ